MLRGSTVKQMEPELQYLEALRGLRQRLDFVAR